MSEYLNKFVVSFGSSAPEAALWIAVIHQAKADLSHQRKEVREDAKSFLFSPDDDRLHNLMNMLGLDGDTSKSILRMLNRDDEGA